eukprot:comp16722_c1_seq1/m.15016 comp16722_c1_seq1/g.15016  ORF comp16722_c1_seq1/g.15016 comp16722_c1_seq1/m.15016 type:complete len:298 (-) comp16722_c1_seq1:505-1398(-)
MTFNSSNTLTDPTYTYAYDKISCLRGGYFAHVTFCYFIFLSGLAAFTTRLFPRFKWLHVWAGRMYINSMLWATGTSLIIHNSGLPAATLISFIWALGGMSVAWFLINLHQIFMNRQAAWNVQEAIKLHGMDNGTTLEEMLNAEKGRIAESKSFRQRMISLKALHGIIMFVSWMNIAGRIFASNQSGDFTCHTYPVYKQIDTPVFQGAGKPLTLVPLNDPQYAAKPWAKTGLVGWSVALSVGPFLAAALVGAVFSYVAARRQMAKKRLANEMGSFADSAKVGSDSNQPEKVRAISDLS